MPSDIPFFGAYFIHSPINGLVKIGFTAKEPDKRLKQLQRASPVELVPLGVIPGPMPIETGLHRAFADCRHHLEWFKPNTRLEEFLAYGIDPWPSWPIDPERKRWAPRWVEELRISIAAEAERADIANASGWRAATLPRLSRVHLKRPKPRPE